MLFRKRKTNIPDPDIIETDKTLKIAIIGAGAAGLTAAHTLKTLGYKNVTVFEREAEAGGKVCSYEYNGHYYELGALFFDSTYCKTIVSLAEEFKTDYGQWEGPVGYFDMEGKWWLRRDVKGMLAKVPMDFRYNITNNKHRKGAISKWSKTHLFVAFLNYTWLYFKYRRKLIEYPGFPLIFSEMFITFKQFALKRNIYPIAFPMAVFMTSCGYGYYDEVPAINYMKVVPVALAINRKRCVFKNGFQRLWKEVAKTFNVCFNAEITNITRYRDGNKNKIEITTGKKRVAFDRVIVSAPLESSHQFMKLSENETLLFKKIKNYEYNITLIKLKKELIRDPLFPDKPLTGGVADHIYKDTIGHMVLAIKSLQDKNVYTFYQLNDWTRSSDEMFRILKQDITTLGGAIDENAADNGIIIQKRWPYFPHVSAEDLQNGFYEKLMDLQGKQGTYYIGSIMDFESVEHTARFSKYLMERHFR